MRKISYVVIIEQLKIHKDLKLFSLIVLTYLLYSAWRFGANIIQLQNESIELDGCFADLTFGSGNILPEKKHSGGTGGRCRVDLTLNDTL